MPAKHLAWDHYHITGSGSLVWLQPDSLEGRAPPPCPWETLSSPCCSSVPEIMRDFTGGPVAEDPPASIQLWLD